MSGHPGTAIISITDPGTPEARLAASFERVLRLSFYDAVPADEYLPAPFPGLFDYQMARRISNFVREIHADPEEMVVLVHCEYGVSRSAAVALFTEAYSGAPLTAREFTCDANQWVLDRLLDHHPELEVDIPSGTMTHERRTEPRAA